VLSAEPENTETQKISKSDITCPKVEGYKKEWYNLKACLNPFQMSTNVMGFQ
jgi:hypothetical protein